MPDITPVKVTHTALGSVKRADGSTEDLGELHGPTEHHLFHMFADEKQKLFDALANGAGSVDHVFEIWKLHPTNPDQHQLIASGTQTAAQAIDAHEKAKAVHGDSAVLVARVK